MIDSEPETQVNSVLKLINSNNVRLTISTQPAACSDANSVTSRTETETDYLFSAESPVCAHNVKMVENDVEEQNCLCFSPAQHLSQIHKRVLCW